MTRKEDLKVIKHTKKARKQKSKIEIFLFDSQIAGTSHIDNIEKFIEKLDISSRLDFQREEDNLYDLQAIKIIDPEGNKLGYVPQRDNVIFARLMDHGKKIFAKIRKIELKGKWYKIDIAIFLEEERIMSEDSNS
ncbi:HIRAN domain-containing protein [Anaerococcus tetradius]|uniref:HIRAN domain-containing protein n=1 Tax=Anaerococcus tetradius TaxID=33036 RepID=UPI0023F4248B|nr:HIRAN domain-containing protein [Anaerococcus tetradius]